MVEVAQHRLVCDTAMQTYGTLWDLDHPAINAFSATWRKGLRKVWGVPHCTHSSLLPVMSSYLPFLDELCCRTASLMKSCLQSYSPVVSTVAHYGIYYGRMNSHLGLNAFSAAPVMMSLMSYLSLDTWSHIMLTHISPHCIEPQCCFYFELLFVREGVLSCPLLSADDIDMFVDFICIS